MVTRDTKGDRVFNIINIVFQLLFLAAILFPFIHILSVSISDPQETIRGQVVLFPKGITAISYNYAFTFKGFWPAYYNTLWYTVMGTLIGIIMTIITSYPLSRKDLAGRNVFMIFLLITMYFSGGLIPDYLLVKNLNMIDTRWVLVVPGCVSVFYIIMMRTFFSTIPDSLTESARIDGASDLTILVRIIIPLSKAVIAVIVLYFAVGQWNSYFPALIYLNRPNLYPVQVILQKVLISVQANKALEGMQDTERQMMGLGIRYAMIIITILPIICIYPFLQKYFVQGVMIGAVKGCYRPCTTQLYWY
jgi:putative aldouronate transport system permease protein